MGLASLAVPCDKCRVTVYGVNLPWLHGSYGHDLAINEHYPDWGYAFDPARFAAPLDDAKALGFDAVRVWLCEYAEGIVTEGERIVGVHPALIENLTRLSEAASARSLSVYWTLLDANSVFRDDDALTQSILTDAAQTARFAELVAAPIARALDPEVTYALEAVNEPEVVTPSCVESGPSIAWADVGRALRTIGDAVRAERDLRVTAGTMHVFLDELFDSQPALDAVDVHVYHDNGGLPPASQLASFLGLPVGEGIPLIGGECGLPEEGDAPPRRRLSHYLYNAAPSGYDAVFLWRLESWLVEQDASRTVTDAGKAVRMAFQQVKG
ncbi:MAG: hypothetical protein AB8I08_10040 [Sandaracinaceae bacterium]